MAHNNTMTYVSPIHCCPMMGQLIGWYQVVALEALPLEKLDRGEQRVEVTLRHLTRFSLLALNFQYHKPEPIPVGHIMAWLQANNSSHEWDEKIPVTVNGDEFTVGRLMVLHDHITQD